MNEINLGIEGIDNVKEIGRGGSARVFSARQTELDRVVAVKVLSSAWDEDVQRRFVRERKAMGRLSEHPGIVGIHQTGTTANGEPFLIMPLYAGSLDSELTPGGMQWEAATAIVLKVAETMAAAHEQGIIHRDLKPANILLTAEGEPRVADFGISRLTSSETASQSSALTFTPAYSPPEAFTTAKATAAVDVYGLGSTLWALLRGHPPFTDPQNPPHVLEIMNRVANSSIETPSDTTPPAVMGVIDRAMAKLPEQRYSSAAEFKKALEAAVASPSTLPEPLPVMGSTEETIVVGSVGSRTVLGAAQKPEAISSVTAVSRGPNRRALVMALVAGFVLIAGGVGALALTGDDKPDGEIAVMGVTQDNPTVDDERDGEPSGDTSEEPESADDGAIGSDELAAPDAESAEGSAEAAETDPPQVRRPPETQASPVPNTGTSRSAVPPKTTPAAAVAPTQAPPVDPTVSQTSGTPTPIVTPPEPPVVTPMVTNSQPPVDPPPQPLAPIPIPAPSTSSMGTTSFTLNIGFSPCAGYQFQITNSGGSVVKTGEDLTCRKSHTVGISGMSPGTTYTYTIWGRDGNRTGQGYSRSFTTAAAPDNSPAPTPSVWASNLTANSFTLNISFSSCSGYGYSVHALPAGSLHTSGRDGSRCEKSYSFPVSGLAPDSVYQMSAAGVIGGRESTLIRVNVVTLAG